MDFNGFNELFGNYIYSEVNDVINNGRIYDGVVDVDIFHDSSAIYNHVIDIFLEHNDALYNDVVDVFDFIFYDRNAANNNSSNNK